jgi:hypothetical protein
MFVLELRRGTETRSFLVSSERAGWLLSEQSNRQTIRRVRYHDWHRVERAIALIRHDAAALEEQGWSVSG